MLELDAQVRAGAMPRPDAIVLPTGSSGTLAALALGAAHLGWDTEIVGVRTTTAPSGSRAPPAAPSLAPIGIDAPGSPRTKDARGADAVEEGIDRRVAWGNDLATGVAVRRLLHHGGTRTSTGSWRNPQRG
jgi:hypothetical protein